MQPLPLVPIPAFISASSTHPASPGTDSQGLATTHLLLNTSNIPGADAKFWLTEANALLTPNLTVTTRATEDEPLTDTQANLVLTQDKQIANPEGYEIDINDDINIKAATNIGLLNGLRTLSQLALVKPLPKVTIKDEPRYSWRAFSVDVVRHWYGVKPLYRLIDLLAEYKFNVLHLHLSDDQGWRIEIPDYPALTEISSRTQVDGHIPDDEIGFMSLAEYRDLQEYAATKGIIIVPEIDLPGHTHAALHAIPELNADGKSPDAYHGIDVGMSQLRAANPATKPFIETVIDTIAQNTKGEYFHIGGDECPGLPTDEYNELVKFANDVALKNGKKTIAWQEAASLVNYQNPTQDEIQDLPLMQYWSPQIKSDDFVNAAKAGLQVILSPAQHVYLDMKHDENDELGLVWAGQTSLEKSRDWEPEELIPGLPKTQIIGVEGALWSETCRSFDDLLKLIFPRLPAVAEVAWSAPGHKADFVTRLKPHQELWQARGVPAKAIERLTH
jgi:hexosaminidase